MLQFILDLFIYLFYHVSWTLLKNVRITLEWNRDFDGFDLRMRLPAVVSKLYKAINRNRGISYIHCTAGMGRAPAVAVCSLLLVHYRSNLCSASMSDD